MCCHFVPACLQPLTTRALFQHWVRHPAAEVTISLHIQTESSNKPVIAGSIVWMYGYPISSVLHWKYLHNTIVHILPGPYPFHTPHNTLYLLDGVTHKKHRCHIGRCFPSTDDHSNVRCLQSCRALRNLTCVWKGIFFLLKNKSMGKKHIVVLREETGFVWGKKKKRAKSKRHIQNMSKLILLEGGQYRGTRYSFQIRLQQLIHRECRHSLKSTFRCHVEVDVTVLCFYAAALFFH